MTTIPQRLREIAQHLHASAESRRGIGRRLAEEIDHIADELEAPAADAVPVVAHLSHGGELIPLVEQRKHLTTVAALQSRIKALEAENFTLAAGQCIVPGGLCGDEGGSPYCSLQQAASSAKNPP